MPGALALGLLVAGGLATATPSAPAERESPPELQFAIPEGEVENHFYRCGSVAAHLVLRSGTEPRVIVAFPAGNTGAALWFAPVPERVSLRLETESTLEGIERPDGLRGIAAHLRIETRTLRVRGTLLASIRSIRDAIGTGASAAPAHLASRVTPGTAGLIFDRVSVDGRHRIQLQLAGEDGTEVALEPEGIRVQAGPAGHIELRLWALTDEPPLTPFAPGELFTDTVADRPRDQEVFAFLASREKLAAGSWRFLTYFGRDTLLTLHLLMPVLEPAVVEAALGSVFERLGPAGEVAHEEGIGEYAALRNLHADSPPPDLRTPELDYKMIDGEFLLAPAVAAYLLDTAEGRLRATDFLARKTSRGETYQSALGRNLTFVLARTAPFAARPTVENLIALKPGTSVGEWRDSDNGLGGGRVPFDVNAALVPGALNAMVRLYRSGLLGTTAELSAKAAHAAEAWKAAAPMFRQSISAAEARTQVAAYARTLQLDPADAIAAIDGPIFYDALSLAADGAPVPVMHSDASFALFFTDPSPDFLESVANNILRPFPAGLRTAVGVLVANPVFGGKARWQQFTRGDYHGTVVWSWQQALMAAGLQRQLARGGLPARTREKLKAAQRALWQSIRAREAQSAGELWSWEPRDGRTVLAPFGQVRGHVDESNAAQLWSTVYLAVRPPADLLK